MGKKTKKKPVVSGKEILEICENKSRKMQKFFDWGKNRIKRGIFHTFPLMYCEEMNDMMDGEYAGCMPILRYYTINEWYKDAGYSDMVFPIEKPGHAEKKVVYATLTLPGNEKKGVVFDKDFFKHFRHATSGNGATCDDYFEQAYWPEQATAGEKGVYIPSPCGVACGVWEKDADRIVFNNFVPDERIAKLKEPEELRTRLEEQCDDLWKKWEYRKEKGRLAELARDFFITVSYLEESAMYHTEGHEEYNPKLGEDFDRLIGPERKREQFAAKLKVLDDYLDELLVRNPQLPSLLEGWQRKPYTPAPGPERTDYANVYKELVEWENYAMELIELDRFLEDAYNEIPEEEKQAKAAAKAPSLMDIARQIYENTPDDYLEEEYKNRDKEKKEGWGGLVILGGGSLSSLSKEDRIMGELLKDISKKLFPKDK